MKENIPMCEVVHSPSMEPLWSPDQSDLGYLPEGPVGVLPGIFSWVSIQHGERAEYGSLNRLNVESMENETLKLSGRPGFAFPTTDPDYFIVGMERCLQLIHFPTGTSQVLSEEISCGGRGTIINDGMVFPEGVIFGAKDLKILKAIAGLYFWRLRDRQLWLLRDDQICSNGKVIQKEGHQWNIWDIDSPTKQVVRYRFDIQKGQLSESEVALDLRKLDGFPDGMVSTPDGQSVIIAFYNPHEVSHGEVRQYSLVTGQHQATWRVPGAPQVTCPLLWNYCEKVQLIVTTATENMSSEKRKRYPESGSFFVSQTKFDSCDQPHRFDINDLH